MGPFVRRQLLRNAFCGIDMARVNTGVAVSFLRDTVYTRFLRQAKCLFCVVFLILLLPLSSHAGLNVLTKPYYSKAARNMGPSCYTWCSEPLGAPPDYSTATVLVSFPNYCNGNSVVGNNRVAGEMGCATDYNRATASGDFRLRIYADAEPDSKVAVKFTSNLFLNWTTPSATISAGFTFLANGISQGFGVPKGPESSGSSSDIQHRAFAVITPNSPSYKLVEGGTTFYQVGEVDLTGGTEVYDYNTSAQYHSTVSGFNAHYIGGFIRKTEPGDNQIWHVTGTLPKMLTVRVSSIGVVNESEQPLTNQSVTFSVLEPTYGAKFANGLTSTSVYTNGDGLASVAFTLGTATGTYTIKATCPEEVCTSKAKEVTFTAIAESMELLCDTCAVRGRIGREMPNPFILAVKKTITRDRMVSVPITYEVISRIDKNGAHPGRNGATMRVLYDGRTNSYGHTRAYLTPGTGVGDYIVRVRCEDCILGGQEQIARATALDHDIVVEVSTTVLADPEVTPVVQITEVFPANEGKSFTTVEGENYVRLKARLLPVDKYDQRLIRWEVASSGYMDSGRPMMDGYEGPTNELHMRLTSEGGGVPVAAKGRALPLKYRVRAGATISGKVVYPQYRMVVQDEIDKCRQEYVDWSKPDKNLTLPEYFSRYIRSDFLIGVDGVNDPDYVKYIDCHAYIQPSRENDVEMLRSKVSFPIDVTSGFRSPRKNGLQSPAGVWNSVHQFGEAVDIVPSATTDEERAVRFKELWYKTSCPKALERSGAKVMAVCDVGQSTSTYKSTYNESNVFGLANCIHLGD